MPNSTNKKQVSASKNNAIKVRKLTEKGCKEFEDWIKATRLSELSGAQLPVPQHLLNGPLTSTAIKTTWILKVVDKKDFQTRYDMGDYLVSTAKLASLTSEEENDDLMWAWLALYYMPILRAKKTNRTEHWIPAELIYDEQQKQNIAYEKHRHCIRQTYNLVNIHGLKSKKFFSKKLISMGDAIEQLASRKKILDYPWKLNLIDHKYVDKSGHLKKNALDYGNKNNINHMTKKRGYGQLRRLLDDLIPTLATSYDVDVMTPNQIIDNSGSEFK
jgi:hypothetical protein